MMNSINAFANDTQIDGFVGSSPVGPSIPGTNVAKIITTNPQNKKIVPVMTKIQPSVNFVFIALL